VAVTRIWALDASSYRAHALHGEDRAWRETNCYVDLWIELLHALQLDPVAALAFTLASDFEGDQWTFFKYPLEDLRALWGLEVHELNLWRPDGLVAHLEEQVAQGRPVIVEVDSFYLPDTRGLSYQLEHVKTSVAVQEIDPAGRRMGYFHGPGYFQVEGHDYAGLFRLDREPDPTALPPYAEVVKLHALERPQPKQLAARATELLRFHLRRRPATNPFTRYRQRLERDLDWLRSQPLAFFHLYAFATLRQLGANFELAATFLRWLDDGALAPAATQLDSIAATAKTLMLRLARAVTHKKPLDLAPFAALEDAWEAALGDLAARYGP
jgi:hypothetical protein